MENWGANSIAKDSDGLMLCDNGAAGHYSAYCDINASGCHGTMGTRCDSVGVWSGSVNSSTAAYHYYLSFAKWEKEGAYLTYANSVRCVSDIVPNCKTYSGETCTACKDDYYLKNDECKKHTDVSNCKTYTSAEDKCETCKDGYYLSSNQCKARTTVANCATYSATEDKCESCSSGYKLSNNTCVSEFDCSGQYFMKIGSLCVTKYNMGDSDDTTIPTNAEVTVTDSTVTRSSSKQCWQGSTSNTCDSKNGNYSGCSRTVCTWYAANAICENYKMGGKTWRLPSTTEATSEWLNYTINKGNDGLMLCDTMYSPSMVTRCGVVSKRCKGARDNRCIPGALWYKETYNGKPFDYAIYQGGWQDIYLYGRDPLGALSTRCVTNL